MDRSDQPWRPSLVTLIVGLLTWGVFVALVIFLSGCSTAPATVGEHQNCLPLVDYTKDELKEALEEYEALTPDTMTKRLIQDYLAMRDADRVCLKGGK